METTPVTSIQVKEPSLQELYALRDKYERMLALRATHWRARSDPSFEEPDPRAEMARLARDYPGALREIDTLPFEVIVTRLEALETAERQPSRVERWMIAQVTFHRYARGALAAKRWLAGRKTMTLRLHVAFLEAIQTMPEGGEATLFADELAAIARPPQGRLMTLVYAKVAQALETTEPEAHDLVFGSYRSTWRRS